MMGSCALIFDCTCGGTSEKWETARVEMAQIQRALLEWAIEHDCEYPAALNAVGDQFPGGRTPLDPFSKTAYVYERTESGFVLTSLGKDLAVGGEQPPERDIVYTEMGFVSDPDSVEPANRTPACNATFAVYEKLE